MPERPTEAAARERAAGVAAGRAPADVVLRGAMLVDVLGRRTRAADVAFAGERIAAVGDVAYTVGEQTELVDCRGQFLLPGLVEPHFHAGFSQVAIERLAELLVPHGTVVLGTCFSEVAALAGPAAVTDQLERLDGRGLDVLLSPFYAAALGPIAGRCTADDLVALVGDERCVEVREWSDRAMRALPADLHAPWRAALAQGRAIAGHLAGQTGPDLQAAAALGVRSDHEATTVAEALERAALGITVQIRHGSGLRDLDAVLPAITEHGADPDFFAFCSDEQELHDLTVNGHLDGKLRLAVARGVDPVVAVRMATLNAARSMGVDDLYGAVAPGRLASVVLVDDLASFTVDRVFARGRLVAEAGAYRGPTAVAPYPPAWRASVDVGAPITAARFRLPAPDGPANVRVIGARPWTAFTDERVEAVTIAGGAVADPGLAKLALLDRHTASGRLGLGLIRGLDVRRGAVAATIHPGAFDLMVLGADDEDMALAAQRAADLGGGIVVARGGVVRAELPLPLLGIVTDVPLAEAQAGAAAVAAAIRDELGSPVTGLVPLAAFCCMAGYPELKVTVDGLVRTAPDGTREPVPLVLPRLVERRSA